MPHASPFDIVLSISFPRALPIRILAKINISDIFNKVEPVTGPAVISTRCENLTPKSLSLALNVGPEPHSALFELI